MHSPVTTPPEVLIVGAGPAGSTTALLLARAGLRVMLLDRASFPRHKPCGEYLSPGVVRLLHDLGAGERVEELAGMRLRGFAVHAYGQASMHGAFGTTPGWNGAPTYGLGLPRALLDAVLLDLARAAGAEVRERTRVLDLIRESGRVRGVRVQAADGPVELRARLLVGADGIRGVTARRLGLVRPRAGMGRIALVAHLEGIAGLGDEGEMHTGRAGYCGVAPHGPGRANVAMVLRPSEAPRIAGRATAYFREALDGFDGLGPRTRNARIVRDVLPVGPLSFQARSLTVDGALLVGDAGGYYDPFTGQGVYKALRGAQLAAPVIRAALARGDVSRSALRPYERALRHEFRTGFAVEWLVQQFLDHPRLFTRAIRRLGTSPAMADTLVGVTGDVLPARRVLTPWFLGRMTV